MANRVAATQKTVSKLWLFTIIYIIYIILPQTVVNEDIENMNTNLNFLLYFQQIEEHANSLKSKLNSIEYEVKELKMKLDNLLLTKIDNLKGKVDFHRPSVNNKKILELQNKIVDVENNITLLIDKLGENSGDVGDIKERTNILEKELELLNKQLENERRERHHELDSYDSTLINLTGKYNKVSKQLKNLLEDLEEREKKRKMERLIMECIEAVRHEEYEEAVKKLDMINEDNKIYIIVSEIYKHELVKGFDLILKFGDKIKIINKSFITYKALYNEMETHSDNNGYKILKLIISLNNEIIKQNITKENIKKEALNLFSILKNKLEQITNNYLKNKLLHGNDTSKRDEELPEKIYQFDKDYFEKLFIKFIKEMYKSHKSIINDLLRLIWDRSYIEQKIIGISTLFEQIKTNNDLNNKGIINLADYIRKISNMENFYRITDSRKLQLTNVKDNLPKSIKNLIFSNQVCIKNVGRREYFYAAADNLLYNKNRRNVFTWVGGEYVDQGGWKLERINDDNLFHIKSNKYNEFLYAAGFDYNSDRRYVFTWVPGNKDEESVWEIEPDGDNCFIKNNWYNEYLFSSNYKYDVIIHWQRRRVFTWKPEGRNLADIYWQWYIEECNNLDGI